MQKLTCVEVKKLRWRKRMNRYRCGCGDDGSRLSSILAVCGVKNKKCIRCLGWEGETWSGFWVRVGVHGILSYTYAASWSAKGVIETRCGCLCLYFVNLDMVFERIQWFFLFFCCLCISLISLDFSCHATIWSKGRIYWIVLYVAQYTELTVTQAVEIIHIQIDEREYEVSTMIIRC